MLERDAVYDDILDRIGRLEETVEDFREVSRPSEVVIIEGEYQSLAGWLSTGTVLRDVTGKIVLDPTIPRIQIGEDGYIESADFATGVSGFQINGGTAEFNDVIVRGTVHASAGAIGGWKIGAAALAADGGAVGLSSEETAGNDIRIWAGHATPSSAPFRVYEDGSLVATSANVTGTIDANAGHLGSLDVDGVITVGSAAPYIEIDGPNKRIQSSTFVSGYAGMRIGANGDAEFGNVRVRGALTSAVFVKDLVEAQAGSLIVVKSAGVLASDMVVPAAGTWFMVLEDPPGGGFLFGNSDICRCKTEYASGIADIWFTVASRTDLGDGTQRYTCTYASGTRPATYPEGGPALDYGISGGGGVMITADAANAPYVSVFTHAGSPWSALSERGRLGNLNGNWGYSSDVYGVALGQYGTADSITIESTNGVRFLDSSGVVQGQLTGGAWTIGQVAASKSNIQLTGGALNFRTNATVNMSLSTAGVITLGQSAGGEYVTIDSNGIEMFSNAVKVIDIANNGDVTFGQVAASKGNIFFDQSAGRLNFRGNITTQAYVDTDGSITAGAGAVKLDADGITITQGGAKQNLIGWDYSGTVKATVNGDSVSGARITVASTETTAGQVATGRLQATNSTDGVEAAVVVSASTTSQYVSLNIQGGDRFTVSPSAVIAYETLRVPSDPIYINETSNANMTLGLTINQGGSDDEALALKSSDVAHGMTSLAETDTYGTLSKVEATSGGMAVWGFKDADGTAGLALQLAGQLGEAADTAKSTSARGIVEIGASVKSGTTVGAPAADSNILTIRPYGGTKFIFDMEGSAHADVEWTTYDDYDDIVLLTDLERAMLAQRDTVKAGFVEFLQYNCTELERAGLVRFDRQNPGHAMLNTTRLSMALVGAVRQINQRLHELERLALPS